MRKSLIEIDFSTKLAITIKNEKPVVLTDLTLSLLAVNQQFQRFIETEKTKTIKSAPNYTLKKFVLDQSLLSWLPRHYQLFR